MLETLLFSLFSLESLAGWAQEMERYDLIQHLIQRIYNAKIKRSNLIVSQSIKFSTKLHYGNLGQYCGFCLKGMCCQQIYNTFDQILFSSQRMINTIQHQAVLNLLHLCDEDPPALFANHHSNPEYHILTEQAQNNRVNTMPRISKSKVDTDPSEKPANSTQNKENLKKILAKLRDSPSPIKKKVNKKPKEIVQIVEVKTINSEPQSRVKQFKRTPDTRIQRSSYKMQSDQEKDLIRTLVKAKIVEKLKKMQEKKTQRQTRQESFRISTVRELQCLKRGQISLKHGQKQSSYRNLRQSTNPIGSLLNGRSSRVNLKHLLF